MPVPQPRTVEPAADAEVRRLVARHRRVAGIEGVVADPQVGRPRHERLVGNADIRWQATGRNTPQAAGHHAEIGMFAKGGRSRVRFGRRLPRQHFNRAVVVRRHLVMQRADQRVPVGDLRTLLYFQSWNLRWITWMNLLKQRKKYSMF